MRAWTFQLKPERLSITGALSALFSLFTGLAVLSLSYLFCVGVAEAASLDGRMPSWLHPFAEAYSRPAYFAANLPVVQKVKAHAMILINLNWSLIIASCMPVASLTSAARNQLPVVRMIHPQQGMIYTFPPVVRLEAQASDPDGTVTRVEFWESETNFIGAVP